MVTLLSIIIIIAEAISILLLIYVVLSLLISFNVLNMRQQFVSQLYFALGRLFDPVLDPIRNLLPPTGGFDFSPLALFILLQVIIQVARVNMV